MGIGFMNHIYHNITKSSWVLMTQTSEPMIPCHLSLLQNLLFVHRANGFFGIQLQELYSLRFSFFFLSNWIYFSINCPWLGYIHQLGFLSLSQWCKYLQKFLFFFFLGLWNTQWELYHGLIRLGWPHMWS